MLMMTLLKFLFLIFPSLISVAFITLLERKVLSFTGLRVGPNKVSFIGILQPITDAIKLSNKQSNYLSNFTFFFYYFSSFCMIFSCLILYSCLFSDPMPLSFKFSVIIFFLVLGFNSLNSIFCGWSVYSKFSLIGSLRTVSQLISYEAVIYLCFFLLFLIFNSLDLSEFNFLKIFSFFLICPICFYIWIPSFLAELNRTPYDFSEGESELVSGFNTEFGSASFTMIFLAEYGSIIFMCILSSFLFFSYTFFFFFFFFFFVLWCRSVLPRFRFDKLMGLCWKIFIPFFTLFFLFFLMFLC